MIANLDEQVAKVFRLSSGDRLESRGAANDHDVHNARDHGTADAESSSPHAAPSVPKRDRRLDDTVLPVWLL